MHLTCPPKFCISIVFNFSWDGCNTQGEVKNKGYANIFHLVLSGYTNLSHNSTNFVFVTSSLIVSIAYFNVFPDFANLEGSTYSLKKKCLSHYRWFNHNPDLKKKLRGNNLGPRRSLMIWYTVLSQEDLQLRPIFIAVSTDVSMRPAIMDTSLHPWRPSHSVVKHSSRRFFPPDLFPLGLQGCLQVSH